MNYIEKRKYILDSILVRNIPDTMHSSLPDLPEGSDNEGIIDSVIYFLKLRKIIKAKPIHAEGLKFYNIEYIK